MSVIKYFLFLGFAFIITFILTIGIYFEDIKGDVVSRFNTETNSAELYLKDSISRSTLDNEFSSISSTLQTIVNTKTFNEIEVLFTRYFFSRQALYNNSDNVRDNSWKMSDVTVDAKFGYIETFDEDVFEFIASKEYSVANELEIKFQSLKNQDVQNSIATLQFYEQSTKAKKEEAEQKSSWLRGWIDLEKVNLQRSFKIDYEGYEYVTVQYKLDAKELYLQIELLLQKLLLYSLILFGVSMGILLYYHKSILKKDLVQPLSMMNTYLSDILQNKYVKIDNSSYKVKEVSETFSKIAKVSKKISSITNELNINREILQRREITDDLTGLPNKKVFEKDLKTMFVTNSSGYIVFAKINRLGEYTNEHGSNDANRLIEDFAHAINNIFKKQKNINVTFYRLYGAEFTLIIKERGEGVITRILEMVVKAIAPLENKYLTTTNIANFGATPFDIYGTIDSILASAYESYKDSFDDKQKHYAISLSDELVEKSRQLEQTVKDIIQRDDFALRYVFDTFLMDDSNHLLMQEISPILIDSNTFERFPIGTFISVAEKLRVASTFDKLLIQKVIEQFKSGELSHYIAINLSIKSFGDRRFLSWLEGVMTFNADIAKNLVFSVTSYTAAANMAQFKNLVESIHKFNGKVILKRYSVDDLSLESIQELNIDFIRIHKDYCNEINKDTRKKHMVKNIILFSENHDIKVLGDTIKSQDDYDTMSRLGLYATST